VAVSARGRDMPSRHCQLSRPWYASLCRWRDGSGRKIVFEVRARQFVPDSALEGSGFEPSVPLRECRRSEPLARKETSGVGNGVSSTAGPMVRIRFPPPASQQQTVPALGFDGAADCL
jgi:hypothetical protein